MSDASASPIDALLVLRAKAGDQTALEQLIYFSFPNLSDDIHRKLPEEFRRVISIDDIIQETVIAIQLGIAGLRSDDPKEFVAWAQKIVEGKLQTQIHNERLNPGRMPGPE